MENYFWVCIYSDCIVVDCTVRSISIIGAFQFEAVTILDDFELELTICKHVTVDNFYCEAAILQR